VPFWTCCGTSTRLVATKTQWNFDVAVKRHVFGMFNYIRVITWILFKWAMDRRSSNWTEFSVIDYGQLVVFCIRNMHIWLLVCTFINMVEMAIAFIAIFYWMLFDCYVVTVYIVLSDHFHSVLTTYEMLGRLLHTLISFILFKEWTIIPFFFLYNYSAVSQSVVFFHFFNPNITNDNESSIWLIKHKNYITKNKILKGYTFTRNVL